jgi:hypothetical protein
MVRRLGLAVMALLFASAAHAQPAEPAEPEVWIIGGVSAAGRVNMRAEPSTEARLLARLPNGTRLRNRGCREVEAERWCQVEPAEGPGGWIAARFLRHAAAAPSRPTPPEPARPARPLPSRMFDAMGTLPCAMIPGQPTRECAWGALRSGGGTASIQVTGMAGLTRWLYFESGVPVRSDGEGGFAVERIGELFLIRVGQERFEVLAGVVGG